MDRKSMLLAAIKRQKEIMVTCSQNDPLPDDIGDKRKIWLAVKECYDLAHGRLQAFEACLSAMNSDKKMLNFYGAK